MFGVKRLKFLLLGHDGVKASDRKIESERVEGEVRAKGQVEKQNIQNKIYRKHLQYLVIFL